eukprot:SAG31_NODE_905_length_11119_cov_2.887931_13_plen_59_part_00
MTHLEAGLSDSFPELCVSAKFEGLLLGDFGCPPSKPWPVCLDYLSQLCFSLTTEIVGR